MKPVTGRCLCGAVSFRAAKVDFEHEVCHCGMCRRWCGGPVMACNAEGLEFEGEDCLSTYASSDWGRRGFCRRCGSNLFYYLVPMDRYFLSVGAFDDQEPFRLVGEIFVDRKPPGYRFAGDLAQQTEAEFLAKFAPE